MSTEPDTSEAVEQWRCFHCDEVLTTRESAAEHFGDGDYEHEPPLCVEAATTDKRDLVLKNRELWELLQKANHETEELSDKLGGLIQVVSKATGIDDPTTHDLHLALQRAEESGYAKGLQDATRSTSPSPAVEALVEAVKKAETYFTERRNPAPDYLLRRRYREEAEAAIVAALSAYEGKGEK